MVLSQTKVLCKGCNKQVKIQDMISKGGVMLCYSCHRNKAEGKPLSTSVKKIIKKTNREVKKYICNDCKYNFSFDINSVKKLRCPYCGKENVEENNKTSDKLIEASEGYDW